MSLFIGGELDWVTFKRPFQLKQFYDAIYCGLKENFAFSDRYKHYRQ